MWSSRPVGPASGGAVAVGVALLFGSGLFGFYTLTTVAGAGRVPSHTPNWSHDEFEGDNLRLPIPADLNVAPDPIDPIERPDVFAPPAAVMGVMPGN